MIVMGGAWSLAQEIAKEEWQPGRAYTLDICKSEGRYYLLEINSSVVRDYTGVL